MADITTEKIQSAATKMAKSLGYQSIKKRAARGSLGHNIKQDVFAVLPTGHCLIKTYLHSGLPAVFDDLLPLGEPSIISIWLTYLCVEGSILLPKPSVFCVLKKVYYKSHDNNQ